VETDVFKLSWHEEKGASEKGAVNLRNISAFSDDTSKDNEGMYIFEITSGKEVHHFAAKSAEERIAWLKYAAQWAPKEASKLKNVSLTGTPASAGSASQGSSSSAPKGAGGQAGAVTVPVSANATVVEFTQNNLPEFPVNVLQMKLVETIDFSENKITLIPPEIVNIGATLVVLNLSYNNIGTLPMQIGQLRKLEELHLHKNKLQSLPDSIGDLGALQLLSLGENKLTSIPPSIGKLKQLRRLNIAYNVGVSIPNELSQCTQVYWIDISGNKYKQFPQAFISFKLLEILEANNNEFESLPQNFSTAFPLLQQIRLAHNKLNSLPADLGALQGLEELEVTFNNLTALPKSLAKSRAFVQVDNNPLQLPQDVLSKGSNAIKAHLGQ